MTRQSPAVTAQVEKVTPEIAEEWLGKNQHNRNIRTTIVSAYARDMAAGRWRLSGEAVKFANTGELLDGQHRLHAVLESGAAVELLVVRGVDPAAQEVMDSGTARTAADALRLRGVSSYPVLASAARLCILIEAGRSPDAGGVKVTTPEILDFTESHPDLLPAVELASQYRNHIDVPLSVLAYAVWRLSTVNVEACNEFVHKVAEKTYLAKGDPVLALINRLTEIRRNGRIAARSDYLSLIFRAWNHWRSGTQVNTLPLGTRGETIPEPR